MTVELTKPEKSNKRFYSKTLDKFSKNLVKMMDFEITKLKKIYKDDPSYDFTGYFKMFDSKNNHIPQMYYKYGKYNTLVPYNLRHI